jgi:mRNA interferase MazF
MILLRRGDIVLVDFDPARSFEAALTRPALVVSNNAANAVMHVIIVIPLTSNVTRIYPHETYLPVERSGLDRDSKTQPHLLRHVSRSRIQRVLSHLPEDLMTDIDNKLCEHLSL